MVDGIPNASKFKTAIVPVIEQATRGRKGCTVRAYGEMVNVLWQAGHTVAATRLEMLWNELAQTHDFSLATQWVTSTRTARSTISATCTPTTWRRPAPPPPSTEFLS